MAVSDAERARRHRRHRRGDHTACSPERCEGAPRPGPAVTVRDTAPEGDGVTDRDSAPPSTPTPPPRTERGQRGRELWDGLSPGLPPGQRVLLDEACRIADRLDRLDHMLTDRDTWLDVITSDDGDVRLVIDGLLAETRQQATALRGLIAEVAKAAPKAQDRPAAPPSAPQEPSGPRGIANLADAAARRRRPTG